MLRLGVLQTTEVDIDVNHASLDLFLSLVREVPLLGQFGDQRRRQLQGALFHGVGGLLARAEAVTVREVVVEFALHAEVRVLQCARVRLTGVVGAVAGAHHVGQHALQHADLVRVPVKWKILISSKTRKTDEIYGLV